MYNSLSHKEVNLSVPKTKLKNVSIISFAKVIDIALNPNKAGMPPLYQQQSKEVTITWRF